MTYVAQCKCEAVSGWVQEGTNDTAVCIKSVNPSNCADGTSYGKCSTASPGQYCVGSISAPTLAYYLSKCPCSNYNGYHQQGTGDQAVCVKSLPIAYCVDGTGYGKCSTVNPGNYCTGSVSAPNLMTYVTQCKCEAVSGWVQQGTGDTATCVQGKCIDGTTNGQCSSTKPKMCVDGSTYVDNATKCGCPVGFITKGSSCIESKPPCLKKNENICNGSNKTISYNVTYIFDRGYKTIILENLTYLEQTCQDFEITFEGENCDTEKERQPTTGMSATSHPSLITEKTIDCGRCPSICERNPPNGTTCGACTCPPNSGYCDQTGIRDTRDGRSVYCYNELWQVQKDNQGTCQNNFECKSNFCSEGACYNLVKEVSQNKDMLQQILDFLKRIFGG